MQFKEAFILSKKIFYLSDLNQAILHFVLNDVTILHKLIAYILTCGHFLAENIFSTSVKTTVLNAQEVSKSAYW